MEERSVESSSINLPEICRWWINFLRRWFVSALTFLFLAPTIFRPIASSWYSREERCLQSRETVWCLVRCGKILNKIEITLGTLNCLSETIVTGKKIAYTSFEDTLPSFSLFFFRFSFSIDHGRSTSPLSPLTIVFCLVRFDIGDLWFSVTNTRVLTIKVDSHRRGFVKDKERGKDSR